MAIEPTNKEQQEFYSVQRLRNAETEGYGDMGWGVTSYRTEILPPKGTTQRDVELDRLYWHDYNTLFRGAVQGIAKKIASMPFEVTGEDESLTEYYRDIFINADFGDGWTNFIKRIVSSYLRFDRGVFIELIYAGGNATNAPFGALVGLSVLDSLNCFPTGDPEYPVVYYDRLGGYHLMHNTRVIQLVDMPDVNMWRRGYGDCAMSRAIAVIKRQILMGQYIEGRLDDKPAPGVVVASGMTRNERDTAVATFGREQSTDKMIAWGKQLWFYGADPSITPKLDMLSFSVAPEKFDYQQYVNIDVDELALALGVDRQELWQLQGGGLGTATQSETLAQKSRGKAIGDLISIIERAFNLMLPVEVDFAFKWRDAEEDMQEAQKAQAWASAVASMGTLITAQEARQVLANQLDSISDAITDADGTVRRISDISNYDDDKVIADDTSNLGTTESDAVAVGDGGQLPTSSITDTIAEQVAQKDYATTQSLFIQDVTDAIKSANMGLTNKRGLRVIMRSALRNYGEQAYKDGLADGGVIVEELDNVDSARWMATLAEQSQYLDSFADEVIQGRVSDAQANMRASMWGKSLQRFLVSGQLSAKRNGMYEWKLGNAEHCKTCLRLNGQVHRMSSWDAKGYTPRSSSLDCKGFNCKCSLIPTTQKAKGRF